MKVITSVPILSRPSTGKALLGDLAGQGQIIDCVELSPTITHEGVTYEYCGTSDGIGIYKQAGELKELEEEIHG